MKYITFLIGLIIGCFFTSILLEVTNEDVIIENTDFKRANDFCSPQGMEFLIVGEDEKYVTCGCKNGGLIKFKLSEYK